MGTVTNLPARLCAEARDGQILLNARIVTAVEESLALEAIGGPVAAASASDNACPGY